MRLCVLGWPVDAVGVTKCDCVCWGDQLKQLGWPNATVCTGVTSWSSWGDQMQLCVLGWPVEAVGVTKCNYVCWGDQVMCVCVCSAALLTCWYEILSYHYITVTGWLSSVSVSWRCCYVMSWETSLWWWTSYWPHGAFSRNFWMSCSFTVLSPTEALCSSVPDSELLECSVSIGQERKARSWCVGPIRDQAGGGHQTLPSALLQ